MARIGRNEPCPCGSGKKYKKCCGLTAESTLPKRDAIHEVDGALYERIMRFATIKLGPHWDPWADYPADVDEEDESDLEMQLAAPWAIYENRYGDEDARTLAQMFMQDREKSLTSVERAWLDAQSRASLSIWQVLDVQEGKGLDLTDLLTGQTQFVREIALATPGSKGLAVLARVVETPDKNAVFCGLHPLPLREEHVAEAVKSAHQKLRAKTSPLTRRRLQESECSDALITIWNELAEGAALEPEPG